MLVPPASRLAVRAAACALGFDLAYVGLASFGRDRFLAVAAPQFGVLVVVSALALAALAVHPAAALRRAARRRVEPSFDDVDRVHVAAGLAALAVLALHVSTWPVVVALEGKDAFGAYATLRARFATPLSHAAHAVGLGALGLHLYEGTVRRLRRGRLGGPRAVLLGLVVALVPAVLLLDSVAAHAIGRTFLPR